jgi:thiazole/oxazole-forming peptide maturase SagC family component
VRWDQNTENIKALPVQVIGVRNGLVLKRGRIEVRIQGEGAAEIVQRVFDAAQASEGIAEQELLGRFAEAERPDVEALLRHLISRRLLVHIPEDMPSVDAAESSSSVFYWHFGRNERHVKQRVNESRILIAGVNYISRQLAASLRACGIDSVEVLDDPLLQNQTLFANGALRQDEWPQGLPSPHWPDGGRTWVDPESFDCLVATSDFGATSLLRSWNEFCHLNKRPFLPVLLRDLIGYVGPLVYPGETACLECVRQRERTHQTDPDLRRAIEDASPAGAPAGFLPPMATSLGDIAAVELIKFFGLGPPIGRAGVLIEVDLLASDVTAHRVLRMPRCPVCTPLNERPSLKATKSSAVATMRGGS